MDFLAAILWQVALAGALNPVVELSVLNQCTNATGNRAACECALEKLGGKYSEATFLAFDRGTLDEATRTSLLIDMFESVSECFVRDECAEDVTYIFGEAEAKKLCDCAVDRIMKMDDLEQAAFLATEGNYISENMRRFEDKVMEEIMPCLPQKLTPAIRENLVNECAASAPELRDVRTLCSCVTDEVFKKYSLTDFVKDTFGMNPELDKFMQTATERCQAKLKQK